MSPLRQLNQKIVHLLGVTRHSAVGTDALFGDVGREPRTAPFFASVPIAAAGLPLETTQLRQPRLAEGVRPALRVLLTARDHMTARVNALIALFHLVDLGIDARRSLPRGQIAIVARWRSRDEDLGAAAARTEVIRLAKWVVGLDGQIAANSVLMNEIVQASQAAPLLEKTGIGSVTAAICLTAWSHHGRLCSEAAFVALAGVNPIPASSGNTIRQRLNHGGDRRLNRALHIAALTRMTHHPETRAYVEKRQAEDSITKEICRCLKRYLVPQIYRILNASETPIRPV